MTKCIREEVRGFGIRVIDVLPGTVETEMWSKKDIKKLKSSILKPKSVAEVVFTLVNQSNNSHIEEVVIRPQNGDL